MTKNNPVRKATIRLSEKRDRVKAVKPEKFDSPEKYFRAVANSENEAIARVSNLRFK